MNETLQIDLDKESVLVDGTWMDREGLSAKIKALLEKGEYRISRLSHALEKLEAQLASSKLISIRVEEDMAQGLEDEARRRGSTPSSLLRELIGRFLEGGGDEKAGRLGMVDGRWFDG